MEKQNEQPQTPQEHTSHLNKKFAILLVGVIAILLFFITALLLQVTSKKGGNLQTNPSLSPSQTPVNPTSAVNHRFNPLINNKEVDRVESAIKKQMEKAGITVSPKPEYKFHYELDPGLENKSSFRFVKPVLAANTCNINSAPATLPIYSLKDHLTVVDAKEVAATYEITADPSGSLASIDGTSFDYFFSDAVVSPRTIAQTELEKHKLSDKAELKNTKRDPGSGFTVFHYEKNYDNLIMTDKASITALSASTPICSVTPSTLMNYIDIYVTPNNYFQKLVNKTRHVLESYPVKRATLEESLNEYQTDLPIDPIVIGGTDTTGDVTIDEAVLVWYDYGDIMPQTAYIPMYLTSGRTPNGTRVLTLFPALTKLEMNNTKIPQLSSESRDTLQMYIFNPPFASPPPPQNPGEGTPYPTIPGKGSPICSGAGSAIAGIGGAVVAGGAAIGLATSIGGACPSGDTPGTGLTLGAPGSALGGCFGNAIDFWVICMDSTGSSRCNFSGSTPTDNNGKNDPFGVCKNGAQTRNEILDLPAGSNPCMEFVKKTNISMESYYGDAIPTPVIYNYKGGPIQCEYQASPC